jgi:hypothetical protein
MAYDTEAIVTKMRELKVMPVCSQNRVRTNQTLTSSVKPADIPAGVQGPPGAIRRKQRLGEMPNYYYRQAAWAVDS